jgi:O-acetyl-ADP-ribose deacetylase (regulator of RNase III)
MPVVFEVVDGARAADLTLADAETLDDIIDAIGELAKNDREIVFDLRSRGRPAITLPSAVDAAAERLAELAPNATLRCLVDGEDVAQRLKARFRAEAARRSRWRTGAMIVELQTGDIIAVRADAVVNASNTLLRLGAGVSGALRRACGPGLQAEMSTKAPIEPGGLARTGAYDLVNVRCILHVATASGGADVVHRALANVLVHAAAQTLDSVATPALGTGTGGLAIERCAAIFRDVLAEHAATAELPRIVRVVLWTLPDFDAFAAALAGDPRFAREP